MWRLDHTSYATEVSNLILKLWTKLETYLHGELDHKAIVNETKRTKRHHQTRHLYQSQIRPEQPEHVFFDKLTYSIK